MIMKTNKNGIFCKTLNRLIALFLLLIFIGSGSLLLHDYLMDKKENNDNERIAQTVEDVLKLCDNARFDVEPGSETAQNGEENAINDDEINIPGGSTQSIISFVAAGVPAVTSADKTADETDMREEVILPQYRALHDDNADMIGWIRLEGTKINYPVMHTPQEPEYYLHMNFEKTYAYSGLPFLDARCDPCSETQNFIIYAHNMKNGTMFGQLPKFESKSFWKEHPIVEFDSLTEQRKYEVFGAFRSHEFAEGEIGFRYYDYINLSSVSVFQEFVENVKAASFYDTGVTPEYGDQLLTLSTCSYHTDRGTFVLVCRRVR